MKLLNKIQNYLRLLIVALTGTVVSLIIIYQKYDDIITSANPIWLYVVYILLILFEIIIDVYKLITSKKHKEEK